MARPSRSRMGMQCLPSKTYPPRSLPSTLPNWAHGLRTYLPLCALFAQKCDVRRTWHQSLPECTTYALHLNLTECVLCAACSTVISACRHSYPNVPRLVHIVHILCSPISLSDISSSLTHIRSGLSNIAHIYPNISELLGQPIKKQ